MDFTPKFEADLKNATSVKDIFNVIEKHYVIEECKPGAITKATVTNGLKTAIKMLKPKLR